MSRKKIFLLCILILFPLSVSSFVYANSGDVLSAWAFTIPDVTDGILSPGEWDDANSDFFTLQWNGENHDCQIYVKNDANNLYIAFKIIGEDYNEDDFILIAFDNDNDNDFEEEGNDGLKVTPAFSSGGPFLDDDYWSPLITWWTRDIDDLGSNDIDGGITHTNPTGIGDYVWEVSHPIDTDDDAHDFSLKPGDIVGFFAYFYDWDVFDCDFWYGQISIAYYTVGGIVLSTNITKLIVNIITENLVFFLTTITIIGLVTLAIKKKN